MKSSGPISANDWRLYACDQESGRDYLLSWGNYDDAVRTLREYATEGYDVWLVGPPTRKGEEQ